MQFFVIDWSREYTTPLIEMCRKAPHKVVGTELSDGAEACRKTAKCRPDAIVINYAVKPLNGRQVVQQLRKRKQTSEIPVYFIGGDEDENEKVTSLGICLSEEEFKDLLEA